MVETALDFVVALLASALYIFGVIFFIWRVLPMLAAHGEIIQKIKSSEDK